MKTIVVLGMHRSGSSIVSAILHAIGVDMGQDAFGQTAYNPTGHFEDESLVKLNNRILSQSGGAWSNPPSRSAIDEAASCFADEMSAICRGGPSLKGFKDPRLCLTIDSWLPHLVAPTFVVCERDSTEIVSSLRDRNGLDAEKSYALVRRYTEDIASLFSTNPQLKYFKVQYSDLCTNPISEIERIAKFLKIELTQEAVVKASALVVPRLDIRRQRFRHLLRKAMREPHKILPFLRSRLIAWGVIES